MVPRSTSTPVPRASRSRSCSAGARAGRRSRCGRTTCRSSCSAPRLLWFGWYGFNAGSALSAGDLAGVAFTNTTIATCTAMLGWLIVEQIRDGKPTTLGAASGAVAGLVAITPACGVVSLARRDLPRPRRRRGLCARGRPEVPVRLRRLARRRRRAPGRRHHRHAAGRLLRHQGGQRRRARRRRPVLRRWLRPSSAGRRSAASSVLVYSFVSR